MPHRWCVCVCVCVCGERAHVSTYAHACVQTGTLCLLMCGVSMRPCVTLVFLEEGVTLGECMSVQHLALCELACLLAQMREATGVSLGWAGRVSLEY